MKMAVATLEGTTTKVLAVTVPTSFDEKTCEEVYTCLPKEQVLKLAAIAYRAGVHGFVCSPLEVKELKKLYPDKIFVTPGVRSPGADHGDQQRVDTPKGAMDEGANKIVMGRQILDAPDPVAEAKRVLKDELLIA